MQIVDFECIKPNFVSPVVDPADYESRTESQMFWGIYLSRSTFLTPHSVFPEFSSRNRTFADHTHPGLFGVRGSMCTKKSEAGLDFGALKVCRYLCKDETGEPYMQPQAGRLVRRFPNPIQQDELVKNTMVGSDGLVLLTPLSLLTP
jgi:hypothetical protein